jgi:hypothetical protein
MTERSFLHPIYSAPFEPGAAEVGDSPLSDRNTKAKSDMFSMDDIGLARGAVPPEIWDWKRRHP